MPFVSGIIEEDTGPIVELLVGVDGPREELLTKHKLAVPEKVGIRALIDTGSALTAIDPEIIEALDLRSMGPVEVLTPSTGNIPHQANSFVVSVSLSRDGNRLHYPTFIVIEAEFGPEEGIQALIGRDLMKNCLFVYDGQHGTFSFAF